MKKNSNVGMGIVVAAAAAVVVVVVMLLASIATVRLEEMGIVEEASCRGGRDMRVGVHEEEEDQKNPIVDGLKGSYPTKVLKYIN